VKIQVEMNPAEIAAFRLIGYENRALAHTDFNDDSKDAGEIGAGHSVTALYEVIPVGAKDAPAAKVDPLEYQKVGATTGPAHELMNVKVRYKQPDGADSKLLAFAIDDAQRTTNADASETFRFSAAVAEMGMLLRDSKHKGASTWASAIELAEHATGRDEGGYRTQLVELMRRAQALTERRG
jgi:Ca-activated chloride channel family protein